MDSVDNLVVPKQNPVGLEGPRMELGLYFTCEDMEKDVRWTEGEEEHHAWTMDIFDPFWRRIWGQISESRYIWPDEEKK